MQIGLQQIDVPPGHYVRLQGIDWPEYEQILEELGDGRGSRLAYDRGALEIMSPLLEHEDSKELLGDFIKILLEELDRDFISCGSTTFRHEGMAKGVEPDQCFYIEHEAQIRGKKKLDMNIDPPPDLAIEIDISSHSHLTIYEALRVPELWRFDGDRLFIYRLEQGRYQESARSGQFPQFALIEELPGYVARSKQEGRNATMRAFRAWVRGAEVRGG